MHFCNVFAVWMKLHDVIRSRSLPLRVRVVSAPPSKAAVTSQLSLVGEDLVLSRIEDETFLRANSINNGKEGRLRPFITL